MEYKKEIEKLLFDLKSLGIDRRDIEETFDYSEFYIDQLLSKGGNQKFYLRLKKYYEEVKDKSNTNIVKNNTDEKDKIIADQAATIKKLTDDVSRLIGLLQDANSLTLKKGYASSILQPYLEQLAEGLAGKQLKGVNDVLEEFDTILGGSLGAGEKSGRYG